MTQNAQTPSPKEATVQKSTKPLTADEKRAKMANYYNPSRALEQGEQAARKAEVERIKRALGTDSADRILSALGHPGYGDEYASKVLYEWQRNPGQSLHAVVYSGIKYGVC